MPNLIERYRKTLPNVDVQLDTLAIITKPQ